ncbi:MAG: 4Fe-4S binding protein [Desulfovibrio sp.]
MLRIVRIVLAALCFAAICLLFVDVSGLFAPSLAIMARVQLVPAVLAGSLGVVAGIALLTLVFGRVYCSVLCPLGVVQDIMGARAGRYRFRYSSPRTVLRLAILGIFALSLLVGVPLVFSLLEPYSAFGRMAADLLAPLWAMGSNAFAWASERAGNYDVAPTMVWQKGLAALAAAAVTLAVIGVLSWRPGGCGAIGLPCGNFLGFLSRFSLFQPRINESTCKKCGLCERPARHPVLTQMQEALTQAVAWHVSTVGLAVTGLSAMRQGCGRACGRAAKAQATPSAETRQGQA